MFQEKDEILTKISTNALGMKNVLQKPKGKQTETWNTHQSLAFDSNASASGNPTITPTWDLLGHNTMQTVASGVDKKWLGRTQELPFVPKWSISKFEFLFKIH